MATMRADAVRELPEQRRILAVLVLAQVLSGAGLAAGITVGALLAQDMFDSTSLAGMPTALFTIGSATTAAVVGRVSQRFGRRVGLTAGYAVGALGSAGVVASAVAHNVWTLLAALFVYGAGSATNLQARYAGADLASPGRRASAISTVLVATTVGGVVGPNLVSATGDLARALGIPPLAGPFLLAGVAYTAAGVVLCVLLRPDPLLRARALHAGDPGREPAGGGHGATSGVLLGTSVMVLTQIVMVAIMTMTPVHMAAHGHGLGPAGIVIAVHVAAMYLPSPVTGWLVDHAGRLPVAAASGCTLLAAGLVAALSPPASVPALAVALALLGLGWNLGLVSGTAIITDAAPLATRARTQGTVDVSIAISGAGGGIASGVVVASSSYAALSLAGGLVALAIVPAVVLTARTRRVAPEPHGGTRAGEGPSVPGA